MTFIEVDKTNILHVLAIHNMLQVHKKKCTEASCFGINVWLDTHNIDFVRRNSASIGREILKLYYTVPEPIPQKLSWKPADFGKSMLVQKETTIVVEWDAQHPFHLTNERTWRGPSPNRMGVVVDKIRRTTTFRVPNNYVDRLYYYCHMHESMGLTEIAFAAKPWIPHGIFASTTTSTLLRSEGPVMVQIEGWYGSTMYTTGINGINTDVQRASYAVLLTAEDNTTEVLPDYYDEFAAPEHAYEEKNAYSVHCRPHVRPVLIDTSACVDLSNVFGGAWSAQWPSRISMDRDMVVPTGLCDLDTHLHTDYEAFAEAGDIFSNYQSPQSSFESEMRLQTSPFTADDVWNDNLLLLPENAENTRLAIVSCMHMPGDAYDHTMSGDAYDHTMPGDAHNHAMPGDAHNHAMPASTDFSFLKAEGHAVDTSIQALQCYGTFCMLSIRTAGCVNSQHIQRVWPHTPYNNEYMVWHTLMMHGSTAVEIIPFDFVDSVMPQNEDFMGFPAYAVHMQLGFDCVDVVLDQPCSSEEMRRHLANFGTFFALNSISDDETQPSTITVFGAFEDITRVDDVYTIPMSVYSFLDTNAVIMNYIRGGTVCPIHTVASAHTNTLHDNNVIATIKCVVCGLNTYYSHQPQTVTAVDHVLDFYLASFEHVDYQIKTVDGNFVVHEVPTKAYYMTTDPSVTFITTQQLHSDEVVVEAGTTLVVHSAHALVFTCEGADIAVQRHNATSVYLYVGSQYGGKAIFVQVLDHAAPYGTLVRPAVLFPRVRMLEPACLACPAGKFSGEHAAPDVSKCLDVQVPPALRETSILPPENSVRTEMPIMTYMQVEDNYISVLALRHAEKHTASSEFAFVAMLGTTNIDLVHRHAAFIESKIFGLYHGQASALADKMYSTHSNITQHSSTNVVLFRLEGIYNVQLVTTNPLPPIPPPPPPIPPPPPPPIPPPPPPIPPPPPPVLPPLTAASPFVVAMAVSMPISIAEFDNSKQSVFKAAVAATASVSPTDVGISNIASITAGGSRRLLAAGIRVDFHVNAATQSASTLLENRLGSADVLNTNLRQAGLPQATVLVTPKTTQTRPVPATTFITSNEVSAGHVWDWWTEGMVVSFILLLIITGVAACVYTRQINTYTGQGMQIVTPVATPTAGSYHQTYDFVPSTPPPSAPLYDEYAPSAPPPSAQLYDDFAPSAPLYNKYAPSTPPYYA